MEWIYILGFIGASLVLIGIIFELGDSDSGHSFIACFFAFILFIIISVIGWNVAKRPTAIDVYRGNTTLEITYKDSIPVDTVVVFK